MKKLVYTDVLTEYKLINFLFEESNLSNVLPNLSTFWKIGCTALSSRNIEYDVSLFQYF